MSDLRNAAEGGFIPGGRDSAATRGSEAKPKASAFLARHLVSGIALAALIAASPLQPSVVFGGAAGLDVDLFGASQAHADPDDDEDEDEVEDEEDQSDPDDAPPDEPDAPDEPEAPEPEAPEPDEPVADEPEADDAPMTGTSGAGGSDEPDEPSDPDDDGDDPPAGGGGTGADGGDDDGGDDDGGDAPGPAPAGGGAGDDDDDDDDDGGDAPGPTPAGGGGAGGEDDDDDDDDDDDGGVPGPSPGSGSGSGGEDDDDDDDDDGGAPGPAPAGGGGSGAGGGDDDDDDDDGGGAPGPAPAGGGTSGGDDVDDADDDAGPGPAPGGGETQGGETAQPPSDDRTSEPTDTATRTQDDDADDSGALAQSETTLTSETSVYVGVEPEVERRELDRQQGIERDDAGFRFRSREIVALDLTPAQLDQLGRERFQVVRREALPALGVTAVVLRTPPGLDEDDAITRLESFGLGAGVGLNHLYDRAAVRTAGGPTPRRQPRAACGCRVGIIDTGVAAQPLDPTRARLVQRAFNGETTSADTHGTVVASLISGTRPFPGRDTTLVVGDIFSGPRDAAGSSFVLIRALNWMAQQNVGVINVSLAGPYNRAVAATLQRLAARGHLIVAAAGNDGPAAPPAYPAAYPEVIAVTAIDARGEVYRYANRGAYVDFAARGVDVVGLDAKGRETRVTGTSFAAPQVAMQLAQRLDKPDPGASRAAVRDVERRATDAGAPGRDPVFGAGVVADLP